MFRTLALSLMLLPGLVAAQDRRPSHCIAVANAIPDASFVWKANWQEPLEEFDVRISYVDHATFLIQAGELSAATDYTGFLGLVDLVPDVVTMNNGHETHWTSMPDPAIPHVFEGWPDENGMPREHYIDLGEMLVRNVPTDQRSRFGDGIVAGGNSIFVFEAAGLCIGHLGHLHHALTDRHYAALGRLDVVMAPVDGGFTLSREELKETLSRLRASIVIPMHWFSPLNLQAFLDEMSDTYAIERLGTASLTVSLRTLPDRPTVMVMGAQYLRDFE